MVSSPRVRDTPGRSIRSRKKKGLTQTWLGRLLAAVWFGLLTSVIVWEIISEVPLAGQTAAIAVGVTVLVLAGLALWRSERMTGWFLITVAPALSVAFPVWASDIGLHPIGVVAADIVCLVLPSLAGGMLLLDGHRARSREQTTAL